MFEMVQDDSRKKGILSFPRSSLFTNKNKEVAMLHRYFAMFQA